MGLPEADRLGIYESLRESCGHEVRYWAMAVGGVEVLRRDLVATIPGGFPVLTFYHPEMQECLFGRSATRGCARAARRRRQRVTPGVRPGSSSSTKARVRIAAARLVVGADGRNSAVRKWAGF